MPRRAARSGGRIAPDRIVIRGPLVHIYYGQDTAIWRRGLVGFCVPRANDPRMGRRLRRCVMVTVPGAAACILDCRAFTDDAFADLVRHLRNFESIGDSAQNAWELHPPVGEALV